MIRLLLIDNYDSFTYNLAAVLRECPGVELTVLRNDAVSAADLDAADALVLSPGPGIPQEAGDLLGIIAAAEFRMPIFGVCLGLQALATHYGGTLENLTKVYHGVPTAMQVTEPMDPIFAGVPEIFSAGRYHSWIAASEQLPACLQVTAIDDQGQVMAFRHRERPIYAVQFHPESVLTPEGPLMLQNFVATLGKAKEAKAA